MRSINVIYLQNLDTFAKTSKVYAASDNTKIILVPASIKNKIGFKKNCLQSVSNPLPLTAYSDADNHTAILAR